MTPGVYGPVDSSPGSRELMATWTSPDGMLHLFGGHGYAKPNKLGYLNDHWSWDPTTSIWTFLEGADSVDSRGVPGGPAAVPSARLSPITWVLADGTVYLFGGEGISLNGPNGLLSDLWMLENNQWSLIGISNFSNNPGTFGTLNTSSNANLPPSRKRSLGWYFYGSLYLFGGLSPFGLMNDMWEYNLSTSQWRWIGGSSSPNALGTYTTGKYWPGSRYGGVSSIQTGIAGIFGGNGYTKVNTTGALGDVWNFNHAERSWSFGGGSDSIDYPGNYGNKNVTVSTNFPSGRFGSAVWSFSPGVLYLFGGSRTPSTSMAALNDMWIYNCGINKPNVTISQSSGIPASSSSGTPAPSTSGTPACPAECWDGQCLTDYDACQIAPSCPILTAACNFRECYNASTFSSNCNLKCASGYQMCGDGSCISLDLTCHDFDGCPYGQFQCPDGTCSAKLEGCMCSDGGYRCADGHCSKDPTQCFQPPYWTKPAPVNVPINSQGQSQFKLNLYNSKDDSQICTITMDGMPLDGSRHIVIDPVTDSEARIQKRNFVEFASPILNLKISDKNGTFFPAVFDMTLRCILLVSENMSNVPICLGIYAGETVGWKCLTAADISSDCFQLEKRADSKTGSSSTQTNGTFAFLLDFQNSGSSSSTMGSDVLGMSPLVFGAVIAIAGMIVIIGISMVAIVIFMRRRRRGELESIGTVRTDHDTGRDEAEPSLRRSSSNRRPPIPSRVTLNNANVGLP
eukprot:TRINITY_DN2761_c0_g1_i1.p1 TRINITY_DN2761_c0_g1~~TRINITY_DN2761_c0_g1_i1.p1  ORF type:complete len:852 (+),score=174.43 TRINITY_DN2761_c0_g1_i1:342-2558(+)